MKSARCTGPWPDRSENRDFRSEVDSKDFEREMRGYSEGHFRGRGAGTHEGSRIHDPIIDWLRAVDGELERLLALDELLGLSCGLHAEETARLMASVRAEDSRATCGKGTSLREAASERGRCTP